MKRTVLLFGTILGALLCINLVYAVNLIYNSPDFKGNDVLGYIAMVLVFSLTFFGIRSYRNKQLNGFISFGKAFKTGALIALLGASLYVAFWMFYYYLVVPDFLDKYIPHALAACRNDPAKLETTTKQMESLRAMYKNPLLVILLTYMEVLPVGLLVALVSALILKRKNPADRM
jgi:amino acid transporter